MIKSEHLWACTKSMHLHIPITLFLYKTEVKETKAALDRTTERSVDGLALLGFSGFMQK